MDSIEMFETACKLMGTTGRSGNGDSRCPDDVQGVERWEAGEPHAVHVPCSHSDDERRGRAVRSDTTTTSSRTDRAARCVPGPDTVTESDEARDVRNAQAGDHAAFERAIGPYRQELHRHSYRMTGSVDDADDIVQETLFRAWRSLGTYAGRSSFRAWLYRIATNRSIDVLGGKERQEIAVSWDGQDEGLEPMWLQPYHPGTDPAAVVESREDLAIAFVTAIQRLPPKQRAALLLRDVLGFSIPDAAHALDTTEAATNSALQRARANMPADPPDRPATDRELALRDRLIDAWHQTDIGQLTALMATDVTLTMPPDRVRIESPIAVTDFMVAHAPNGRLDQMRLLPIIANRQPAVGIYTLAESGDYERFVLMTLDIAENKISRLTAYFIPPSHFDRFNLPETYPQAAGT